MRALMARSRKPRPDVPAAATTPVQADAPLPASILAGPRLFARSLAPTEPLAWRYLGVVALAAVLSGGAYAALVRPAVNLAAEVAGGASPLATHALNVIGGAFLSMFTFLLMWGLGLLGAGRSGRPAEVFGATFALLPPLYVLVIVLSFLIPDGAWRPAADALAAVGKDPNAAQRLGLAGLKTTSAAFLLLVVTLAAPLVQSGLAFVAFRELTGRAGRAALGALLPLLPALAVGFISLAPVLLAR